MRTEPGRIFPSQAQNGSRVDCTQLGYIPFLLFGIAPTTEPFKNGGSTTIKKFSTSRSHMARQLKPMCPCCEKMAASCRSRPFTAFRDAKQFHLGQRSTHRFLSPNGRPSKTPAAHHSGWKMITQNNGIEHALRWHRPTDFTAEDTHGNQVSVFHTMRTACRSIGR